MIYNLDSILDKERFKRRCNALYKRGGLVELSERKGTRTLSQNAYLHLILGWFAVETGNRIDFVKEQYFKRLVNAAIFCEKREDRYLGEVEVLRSSKDLDTGEMTTAIERFRNWSSAEAGIYLPAANEQGFLNEIEVELRRQQEHL